MKNFKFPSFLLTLAVAFLFNAAFSGCNSSGSIKKVKILPKDKNESGRFEDVYADSAYRLTGVAVSAGHRVFVNFPNWAPPYQYAVIESFPDGTKKAYPNAEWNSFRNGEDGRDKFVCVQAVYADDNDCLWVVDAAGIGLAEVYRKSNKVVKINLKTNAVERIYRFDDQVAGPKSYINDIRIDNSSGYAYLTSSSNGSIIVMNIRTGSSRAVLTGSRYTLSDKNYAFRINGKEWVNENGPVKINADGIALSPDKRWLYFKPLTDRKLYRIKTSVLRNFQAPLGTIRKSVELLGDFVTTDGMEFDDKGNLYLGDLESSRLMRIGPDFKMAEVARDTSKLIWPDSYSFRDGYLYISCSQIQYGPFFNKGKDIPRIPYRVIRIKVGPKSS
jgi:sugar lactone lactonase YvrE